MKLSVLIPLYNDENYIGYCIDSLINQDLPKEDYEVIIMDDGSTDNSFSVAKSHIKSHSNFIIHSENNEGTTKAREKLLKLARGIYTYFVDADDYIAHNSLGLLIDIAINNDVDVLGFKLKETYSLNEFEFNKENLDLDNLVVQSGFDFIKENKYIRHENCWFFLKKSFLDEFDIHYNLKGAYVGDVLFTLKVFSNARKVVYCPVSVYRYVQTQDSAMRSKDPILVKRLIEAKFLMIIQKSEFINSLSENEFDGKSTIINNLTFRRDIITFFTLIKMIKARYRAKDVLEQVSALKEVTAYPINNFIEDGYNTIVYKILNVILNSRSALFVIVFTKNMFLNIFRFNKK